MINEYNINININIYIMLFRNIDGEIIEIKKYTFVNDYIYYTKIMEMKQPFSKVIKRQNNLNYSNMIIDNHLKPDKVII
jgi:wyosine [tRNA(Phe)-imidazoG37] synthetase (radical SAM superfamily)